MMAGSFIETIEQRQGMKICCPEEIAYSAGWISKPQLQTLGESLRQNSYGQYLLDLARRSRTP